MIKEGEDLKIILKSLITILLKYCNVYNLSSIKARL